MAEVSDAESCDGGCRCFGRAAEVCRCRDDGSSPPGNQPAASRVSRPGEGESTAREGSQDASRVEYREEWDELCQLMLRGVSFLAACGQLGLDPYETYDALRLNLDFGARMSQTQRLLTMTVESALLQSALKGKVAAQLFWLSNRDGRRWTKSGPKEFGDGFEDLPDEQLQEMAERWGVSMEGLGLEGVREEGSATC